MELAEVYAIVKTVKTQRGTDDNTVPNTITLFKHESQDKMFLMYSLYRGRGTRRKRKTNLQFLYQDGGRGNLLEDSSRLCWGLQAVFLACLLKLWELNHPDHLFWLTPHQWTEGQWEGL